MTKENAAERAREKERDIVALARLSALRQFAIRRASRPKSAWDMRARDTINQFDHRDDRARADATERFER